MNPESLAPPGLDTLASDTASDAASSTTASATATSDNPAPNPNPTPAPAPPPPSPYALDRRTLEIMERAISDTLVPSIAEDLPFDLRRFEWANRILGRCIQIRARIERAERLFFSSLPSTSCPSIQSIPSTTSSTLPASSTTSSTSSPALSPDRQSLAAIEHYLATTLPELLSDLPFGLARFDRLVRVLDQCVRNRAAIEKAERAALPRPPRVHGLSKARTNSVYPLPPPPMTPEEREADHRAFVERTMIECKDSLALWISEAEDRKKYRAPGYFDHEDFLWEGSPEWCVARDRRLAREAAEDAFEQYREDAIARGDEPPPPMPPGYFEHNAGHVENTFDWEWNQVESLKRDAIVSADLAEMEAAREALRRDAAVIEAAETAARRALPPKPFDPALYHPLDAYRRHDPALPLANH